MFELIEKSFAGPNNLSANFIFRADTADENTINATYKEDEYKFQTMVPAAGDWMIDGGGYVGSTAILYAQLFPQAKIICVEPLPENVQLIKKNIERNGLSDRIILVPMAMWSVSGQLVKVYYRDTSTVGQVHRFVASAFKQYHETVAEENAQVLTVSLHNLIVEYDIGNIRFLKMDMEGAEYEALNTLFSEDLAKIQTMVGEYHNIFPNVVGDPRTLLFEPISSVFDDKSPGPEVKTWGAFLFERKPQNNP